MKEYTIGASIGQQYRVTGSPGKLAHRGNPVSGKLRGKFENSRRISAQAEWRGGSDSYLAERLLF